MENLKEAFNKNMEESTLEYDNEMTIEFDSKSQNESFARMVVSAFASQLNPTIEELADIKTAVSEAVTNSIIHGYGKEKGKVKLHCYIKDREIGIAVSDQGVGIENVLLAMEPLYTSRPELERSGMGFAFMEAFMDELEVKSKIGEGTVVIMKKVIQTT
ncbi:anti-sigma F factor [Clostridium sp. Marseille-P299]|uniref:anti-sigma F factor n=1 Tax=Clostridium sp. Marseille-P299 TaxID=1805477 RepID=UPI000B032E98|nr:anti-sigma F factor [Clostridium sp. Marseille-P299]